MTNQYFMTNDVLHRLVQILQLAMLTGVDIADLLKQMRFITADDDPSALKLTPEYDSHFRDMIKQLEKQADDIIASGSAERAPTADGAI